MTDLMLNENRLFLAILQSKTNKKQKKVKRNFCDKVPLNAFFVCDKKYEIIVFFVMFFCRF
jgi:hypothetical protein